MERIIQLLFCHSAKYATFILEKYFQEEIDDSRREYLFCQLLASFQRCQKCQTRYFLEGIHYFISSSNNSYLFAVENNFLEQILELFYQNEFTQYDINIQEFMKFSIRIFCLICEKSSLSGCKELDDSQFINYISTLIFSSERVVFLSGIKILTHLLQYFPLFFLRYVNFPTIICSEFVINNFSQFGFESKLIFHNFVQQLLDKYCFEMISEMKEQLFLPKVFDCISGLDLNEVSCFLEKFFNFLSRTSDLTPESNHLVSSLAEEILQLFT